MNFPVKGGRSMVLALCIAGAALAAGCSDSPTSSGNEATVTMSGEMAKASVGRTLRKEDLGASIAGGGVTADSLKISRVRVLISELKLHRNGEDTTSGDKTVKLGPIMITIDSAGTRTFTTSTVPAGTYDKLKFEFHRFSASEVGSYLNDTNFADFVTNERSTFVIEGMVYNDGQATPFEYKSDATANLSLKFDTPLTLAAGSNTTIAVVFDPVVALKDGQVLDPRDPGNEPKIDNAIKAAIHALKK